MNGLRFWFLHYIAPINVRFCAFIRPLMFNLLSTPRKVREQKQECVCVWRDWRGPRVSANQRRVSLMSFQRTEHTGSLTDCRLRVYSSQLGFKLAFCVSAMLTHWFALFGYWTAPRPLQRPLVYFLSSGLEQMTQSVNIF